MLLNQGCGVKENVLSLTNLKEQEGLVVGTIKVEINGKDVTDKAAIFFDDQQFGTNLKSLSANSFFAFSFEEGRHNISGLYYYEGFPAVPLENQNINYSFDVKAGKANYLGELVVNWVVNPQFLQEPPGSIIRPKYGKYAGKDLGSITIATAYDQEKITQSIMDQYGTSIEIIQTEINAIGDPEKKDSNGYTALMRAAVDGSLNVGEDLIAKGADVNAVHSREGYSVLIYAIANDNIDFVKLLLINDADVNFRSNRAYNEEESVGISPLFVAVMQNNLLIAKLLLENGADPDIHLANGSAMLIACAALNRTSMTRLLLENGADVNIRNNHGTTPLMYASSKGYIEMVKLLLEYKADPTLKQNDGWTALSVANQNGFITIAELIRTSISDISQRTKPNRTAPKMIVTFSGTGWVTVGGYIVTNYHVIENHSNIYIIFNSIDDTEYPANVVLSDRKNDLAILKLVDSPSIRLIPGLPISSSFPKTGEKVFTLGYPKSSIMGRNPKVTDGIISALSGIRDDPTVMQISVPIQSGNSGGPLMNMQGEVVGVTSYSLTTKISKRGIDVPQNVNYAVKTAYLNVLLANLPIDNTYPTVKVTGNHIVDMVPQIKNSVAHIVVKVVN